MSCHRTAQQPGHLDFEQPRGKRGSASAMHVQCIGSSLCSKARKQSSERYMFSVHVCFVVEPALKQGIGSLRSRNSTGRAAPLGLRHAIVIALHAIFSTHPPSPWGIWVSCHRTAQQPGHPDFEQPRGKRGSASAMHVQCIGSSLSVRLGSNLQNGGV